MSRSRSPGNVIAALFTRTSTGPKCSTVAATMCSTSASLARFVGTAIASPPASVIRRTVSSIVPGIGTGAASVARAAHTTLQPRSASMHRGRRAHSAARSGDDRDLAVEVHVGKL